MAHRSAGRALARRALAATIAVCLLSPAIAASPERTWVAEYYGGELALRIGSDVRVTVEPGQAVRFERRRLDLHVPPAAIVSITRDTQPFRPVKSWAAGGLGAMSQTGTAVAAGPYGAIPLIVTGIVVLVGSLLLAPIEVDRHFVAVVWDEGDVRRSVTLKITARREAELVSALEQASGRAAVDLAAMRRRVRDEIEARAGEAVPLTIERTVLVPLGGAGGAAARLAPGEHRLLLVAHEGGTADAFFFAGDVVRPDRPRAIASVRFEPAGEAAPSARLDVRGDGMLEALTIGDRRAVFAALPERRTMTASIGPGGEPTLTFQDRPPTAWVARLRGEGSAPAIVVEAATRAKGGWVTGRLEIGRDRVRFAPLGESVRAELDVARSEIAPSREGRAKGAGWLRTLVLRVGDRKRTFVPCTVTGPCTVGVAPPASRTERMCVDFLRLAVEDFDAAVAQFEVAPP